ncbi:MAG TPA: ribbon-helix-helix protein, CopG family [Actinomycetota bacterium]
MRTTIRLDDALLAEAKAHAAKTGRTLTALIEDALRASLAVKAELPGTDGWTSLPTVGGTGLRPGVDLDSASDLLDIMERDDPR